MIHSKLIPQEILDSIPVVKSSGLDKLLSKAKTASSMNDWHISDVNVHEAELILLEWLKKAVHSDNSDLVKKIATVNLVITKASLIYWKAYTYEIMERQYKEMIKKYQSNEFEMSEEISKLRAENEALKNQLTDSL